MSEETVGQLLDRAHAGETLTPEETARVQEWIRTDVVPAVQRAQDAIVAAFKPAFENIAAVFNGPQGRLLIALGEEWEARKHADPGSQ